MTMPHKYNSNYIEEVVEHMKGGKSLSSFAASIGVSRKTIDNWREQFPDFANAVEVAKAAALAWWEDNAKTQATREKTGSASITIFMLKNYGGSDFQDRQTVEHVNPGIQQIVQYQLPSNGRDPVDTEVTGRVQVILPDNGRGPE